MNRRNKGSISISCKIGQEWYRNRNNAIKEWKECPKGKNCVKGGPAFSGRPWRHLRTMQDQDAPPPRAKVETSIMCILLCSVTAKWLLEWYQKHLGLRKSSVHRILTENLEIKKVCAKMVPQLPTPEQKLGWKECCIDRFGCSSTLARLITSVTLWPIPSPTQHTSDPDWFQGTRSPAGDPLFYGAQELRAFPLVATLAPISDNAWRKFLTALGCLRLLD